ncbi:MAG: bifunctional 5,10-methylenetetrahydrofolate dehydrogenase/5,10-methenyltetrahydrofolate cyclohydrolase [Paludibacteraceae bacterium]|nr:bifunctional 5,10-methylenetetrahydrofolate dehydrogenase/5,10-methenyltetrahydrofolate cyclohydrolase [Paludibacteraceae bacterium]
MVFDGKAVAAKVLQTLAAENAKLKERYGRVPCLSVLLVGEDYGSTRYVASCEKNAQRAGLECKVVRMAETSSEEEVTEAIRRLNEDSSVDGILVQMPLPKHISQERIVETILPDKDVDGVTDRNVSQLWKQRRNDYSRFCVPCTPRSVMRILEESEIDLDGLNTVVIGRSNIVGMPVSKLLMNENATVTVCHSHTKDLAAIVREADVVVAAIGKAKFVGAEMVRNGAVVVDVGINVDETTGKMCGDVDTEAVKDRCKMITPVPGGVGQLTICSLMENTMDCFKRLHNG